MMKTIFKYSITLLFCLFCIGTLRAQSLHWQCDPYAWEYDMTGYVTLTLNNKAVDNLTDYEIAAFCGSECRGVATIQTSDKDGQTTSYGYLRIRSNLQSGEAITFKVYEKTTEKEYDVEDYTLTFLQQEVVGLPSSPIQLSILSKCSIQVSSSDESKGTAVGSTTVKYGTEITVTATANEGYHFTSWTSAETVISTDASYTFSVEGDASLIANFAPNQYSMTFVLDNGEENVVKTQDYGSGLTAPEDPVKTGFAFKGWSPEVPTTVPASDMTFTAQWERNSYKLTWDVDGVKTEYTVAFEAPITKPEDPVKEGYTFVGWTPEVAETMPAEDVTYTAVFEPNVYAIIYLVNGREWARDSVAYGTPIVLREYTPAEGEIFIAWYSDKEYETMPAYDITYRAHIITSGITEILKSDKPMTIYNIRGELIGRNIPASQIERLPRGIYMIDGKKVIVK